MSRTLYDKIWDEHVVHTEEDGTAILYIDRHLVHEGREALLVPVDEGERSAVERAIEAEVDAGGERAVRREGGDLGSVPGILRWYRRAQRARSRSPSHEGRARRGLGT